MVLSKDFLWGGALAAHQFEGGVLETSKRFKCRRVMTAGAHGVPREITDGVIEGKYYPNHVGIDFYHHYKEDIAMFADMALNVLEHLLPGHVSFHWVMKKNLMKKDYSSMMMFLMNY